MPKVCTVCAHPSRAEIDAQLSVQVVNVAELARSYGLKRDSMRRHRERHLSDFLVAFVAQAKPLDVGTIRAEAERLYLTTLDALDRAQAGVLVALTEQAGGEVVASHRVSMSTVARLIRESRAGLELLTKLSVASGGSDTAPAGVDRELDERIAVALEKVAARTSPTISIDPVDIADAVVVPELDGPEARSEDPGTPGPTPAAGAHPARVLKDPSIARAQNEHDEDARPSQTVQDTPCSVDEEGQMRSEKSPSLQELTAPTPYVERVWDGNPAASAEERRAAGFQPIPLSFPRREDLDGR